MAFFIFAQSVFVFLEGMPLSDFDIELVSKVVDGEITREEAFRQLNASLGING